MFELLRLKIHAYNVSDNAYATLYTGWKVDILVQPGKKMPYVFMDIADHADILFECQDFTFVLEEVDYDEL
ncbi:hypothetical protein KDI_37370 [Dictyobacter arantiisoli]|uniref:Uncharacterized protein n=1 Tax=Dictyobacter arantiisoli TaxID=2014874 RepID=A0A5A5TGJ3_9CHLR|nr:hypothetical protein KDI_37370 [Dictyobacter arantiisoli]